MPDNTPAILLTRPTAQSEEFRQMLGRIVQVVISPVIDIRLMDFSISPDEYDIMIFASQNAVLAAARVMQMTGRRAIAVGDRTAREAKKAGMSVVSADGTSRDLIAAVIHENPAGKVLFVRGRYSRGDVEDTLNSRGIDTFSVIGYDQVAKPLSAQARALLGRKPPVILPLFSSRSAAILAREVRQTATQAPLVLVGMSREVLVAWDGPEPAQSVAVSRPTTAAMAAETLRLFDQWP